MNINDIEEIKYFIKNSENSQTEFKETTGQLERGMETMCAFLNGAGGTLLFGINDKGKIIGQEVTDNTKRNIAEAINRLEPLAEVQVAYNPLPNSNKYIIVFHAEEARFERPFCYKGRAYLRIESVTTTMPQSVYNELLMQRGGKYGWEAMTNPNLQITDLDDNIILGAVRAGIDSGRLPENTIREDMPAILEKFDLLHNNQLNNAAAVLFGNNFYDYPQCLLRMARFKGTNKNEFIDNQRVQGNIYNLLDVAMAFFFKHLSLSGKIEGLYREEELSIPYKALRECCINALAHRFYHHPGSSVSIAIYDDRVEITNSGAFPSNISIERLLSTHDSQPQNPIIANVLYKSKVLESWGRGIGLMVDECKRVGISVPEFHTDGGFVWVVFHYSQTSAGQNSTSNPQKVRNKFPTVTQQLPNSHPTVTPQIKKVLTTISTNEFSAKEIMGMIGLKDKSNFLENYLYPAIELALVEPLFPEQPKHPKQKYRLTEKGTNALK